MTKPMSRWEKYSLMFTAGLGRGVAEGVNSVRPSVIGPILTYWIVGCGIMGWTLGGIMKDCPHDDPPSVQQIVASVAVWPSFIAMVFRFTPEKTGCKKPVEAKP